MGVDRTSWFVLEDDEWETLPRADGDFSYEVRTGEEITRLSVVCRYVGHEIVWLTATNEAGEEKRFTRQETDGQVWFHDFTTPSAGSNTWQIKGSFGPGTSIPAMGGPGPDGKIPDPTFKITRAGG